MAQWLSVKSILLLVTGCCAAAGPGKSSSHQEAQGLFKVVSQQHSDETTELTPQRLSAHQGSVHTVQLAAQSADLRDKDKIIKHLTGPLYVSPKCRSQFRRLYQIRDCVIPAYLKRCARLLTRLANSLRCAER